MQGNNIPQVRTVAFAPTGDIFALGGSDGRVHFHHVHLLHEDGVIREALRYPVKEFLFNVGVSRIAFGEGHERSRRLTNRLPSRRLRDRMSNILLLAVGLENGSIRVVDAEKREVFLVLEDHKRSITSLSFNLDGSLVLASTSLDGTCKLWDLWDDGNMYRTLRDKQLDGKACHSCAWAPDSKTICVASGPQHASLWNIETFSVLGRLQGHKHRVTSCDFSPDNNLIATASMDTSVIVWEHKTCRPLRQFWHMGYRPSLIYLGGANGHYVKKVRFSRDSVHLMTVCDDKKVRLWDLDDGSDFNPQLAITAESFDVEDATLTDAFFCPSANRMVMSCNDQRESFFCVQRPSMDRNFLTHFCRSTIRHSMSSDDINNLPLPLFIKKYLCFKHNQKG